jgi:thiol-disulfide isomerase/thioredoxin
VKKVFLYSRPGCHLCEVVEEQLARLRKEHAFDVEIVDIDGDLALVELYGREIPVVMLDGKKVAKYQLDEAMLVRRLQS